MLTKLQSEYSMRQFHPQSSPLLKNDQKIRKFFGLQDKSPFLYVIRLEDRQSWLSESKVRSLKNLSQRLQENEKINNVTSLVTIEGASQNGNELRIGNIFDRVPQAHWRDSVLRNPLLYPLFITEDLSATLVVVEPKSSRSSAILALNRQVQREIQNQFPNAEVISAGIPLIQTRLSSLIQSELSQFLWIAVLIFCGIFYLLFSHWTAVTLAFVALVCSNVLALGLLAFLKIPMNIILVTLPIVISVTVMSLLIHTLHLWSQKLERDHRAALRTMLELWLPNTLGAFTTALGFLALAPSEIPLIRQYGWSVAVIVCVVGIFTQLLIWTCLPLVKPKMREWFDQPATWSVWPVRYSRITAFVFVCIGAIGLSYLPQLNFSGRLFDDLPRRDGVRASMEWIDSSFGGTVSYDLILDSHQKDFWKDPQHLLTLEKLNHALRTSESIGSVMSVSDFFQTGVPKTKQEVAELYFLFSMAEHNPLPQVLSENGQSLRLAIRLQDLPGKDVSRTKRWIRKTANFYFPNVTLRAGGLASFAHQVNQNVASHLVFNFWHSILLIGLLLIVFFRSFGWALLACLPNVLPPTILIAVLALNQTTVKPGVALIFSIALGFAFNNTTYLLSRVKSNLGKSQTPLIDALKIEGNPCFFESLIMFVGFSIFVLSNFGMNQTFGVLMMLSVVTGFLADLVFLPALLSLTEKFWRPVSATAVGDTETIYVVSEIADTIKIPVASDDTEEIQKVAAAIALIFLCLGFSQNSMANFNADEILKKSQGQLQSKDDRSVVEMIVIEKNGSKKTRKLELKTMRQDGFSVMARIQSPADIKGMGFLGRIDEDKQETQWVYLPSTGQVRRVVGAKTQAGLLGSEISPEDLSVDAIKSARVKLQKETDKAYWLEIFPKRGTSIYTRVVMQVDKQNYLPQNAAYYRQKRLKKTVEFKDYRKIVDTWRAHEIGVKNRVNGRGTIVKFSGVKINSGLKPEDFSQSALMEQ